MSAYEDFCGCGEYSCGQCFNGEKDATGNAWMDESIVKNFPNTVIANMALARLRKYGMRPDEDKQ